MVRRSNPSARGLALFHAATLFVAGLCPGSPLLTSLAQASEPGGPSERLDAPAWWRDLAVRYADEIADADMRSQANYDLAHVRARTGDFAGAGKSASEIKNPQLRIYAHCFIAKLYKQKGNDEGCRSELQNARETALASATNGFNTSAVIGQYVEMGWPADAEALAAELPDAAQRNSAFQIVAGQLAKQGNLPMAYDVVYQRLPPAWRESVLSGMADACAREARVHDTLEIVFQLTNTVSQDKAYFNLVNALVNAHRNDEAKNIADRISDTTRQAAAHAKIAADTARNEGVEVLKARVEKVTTREEKGALYDLLFTRLIEAKEVDSAETVIESMIEAIKTYPRDPMPSKFGTGSDALAIAIAQAKYLRTAGVLAGKGDREAARSRIARAEKAILDVPDDAGLGKILLVVDLVRSQVELGELQSARNTLNQLKPNHIRSIPAQLVAVALIKSGDVTSGLEVAGMITGPVGRGEAMGHVVSALLHAGQIQTAKELLEETGDAPDDARTYRAAGGTMMELKRGEQLQHWLDETTSNVARAYMCMGAVDALQKPR